MADTPPPVFDDRYQLVRHIARGGMAQVYLARDLLLDRPVALKVLFPELSVDRNFVERFRREARAAANLSHPNIVSVYDWGQGNRTYYIVMEYVDGHTLSSRIRQGPIPPREAAAIASSVAAALAFAHRHSVIHRDVKPGNVLINRSGQVKVTDFGIARATGASEDLTQAGSVMGTATYFSPEQAQGHRVDVRSDVYSLGVVLYEMVTGRPPFHGENPVAIAYKHVRDQPEPPSVRNPSVPADYEAITLKALAKNPDDRYQSAGELQEDLERFRTGRPVRAGSWRAGSPATTAVAGAVGGEPDATRLLPAGAAAAAEAMTRFEGPPRMAPAGAGAAVGAMDHTSIYGNGLAGPEAVDVPERESRTARRVAIVVLLLALLAVAAFFAGRSLGYFGAIPTLSVPDVRGLPQATATTRLHARGFTNVGATQVTSASVTKGQVVRTAPKPGTAVKANHHVVLDVSAGPATASVPDVAGDTETRAEAVIRARGFTPSVHKQPSTTRHRGLAIGTQPPAGHRQAKGTKVTLLLSTGYPVATVPNVAGKSVSAATLTLHQDGFNVVQNGTTPSSSITPGDVAYTKPASGRHVRKGTTVTIVTSSGPSTINVRYYIGMPEARAEAGLTAHGLTPVVNTVPVPTASQNGIVQSTNPPAGTPVKPGSSVTLVVGVYTPPSTTTSSSTTSTSTTTTTTPTTTTKPKQGPPGGGGPPGHGGGGRSGHGGGGASHHASTTGTAGPASTTTSTTGTAGTPSSSSTTTTTAPGTAN